MTHNELAARLEKRLDILEKKLDNYFADTHKHEADLIWVRGYIKLSLAFSTSLAVGLITTLIKLYS